MTAGGLKIVVHDYSGHPFQIELSRELARRGHRVRHCHSGSIETPQGALVRTGDDPANLAISPITVPGGVAKYAYVRRWRQERRYARLLAARIATDRPDVVVSGNAPPDIQNAALSATHACGGKFVFWLQDIYGEAAKRILPRRLVAFGHAAATWLASTELSCLRRSDAIVAITDDFIDFLGRRGIPAARITTIENWAPLGEIEPRAKRNPWSLAHGFADRLCFLYAGTLGLKHDPEHLATLAGLLTALPDASVVVASQGLGADYLTRAKTARNLDRLTLLPFQPYAALPDMLATADVAIALLEPDAGVFSVPSKILSYFSAGKPVLAAMPGENLAARLIAREGAGQVVPPGDRNGFAAAALALAARPADRAAMGKRGRAYAESHFTIGPIADRFEAIFARVRD